MGEFKQGALPHWDYMWKDEAGRRLVGMVMFPERRKHMKEIVERIKVAYEQGNKIKMTVKVQHTYQHVEGTVVYFDEEAPVFTIQDKEENFHHIFIKDVSKLNIINE
ncbi:hypothetical protein ACRS6Y_02470 [Bacillus cytotoxicus]|uniref:YolD-like family protein n=1 Tax=Bacillus cytotoxicus (strain DSM 22905 / CIP 110041 / 391-98 / NVH 391-98) TaxID=315749 RepID=A7GMP0_BACCN|nr:MULTISPECIES: hypothetical protein [Bacillus cereus group]ABS21398.1 conserved hypothetical protein [Bacillus cytotoxicus NVH 391-98]AWC28044.1 hypothetical protein CG483_006465 [Bacillus cytotoxicus]AWC40574.1 hypothetical protein CG480_008790 [Bacillus cytotoxicus]AWC44109.1 hypothetical protein CG479_006040 [Bacillus cytotoxicus]AWC48505.1 hypothetical protein CG478_008790 [Bacillus cytotoxicus]